MWEFDLVGSEAAIVFYQDQGFSFLKSGNLEKEAPPTTFRNGPRPEIEEAKAMGMAGKDADTKLLESSNWFYFKGSIVGWHSGKPQILTRSDKLKQFTIYTLYVRVWCSLCNNIWWHMFLMHCDLETLFCASCFSSTSYHQFTCS